MRRFMQALLRLVKAGGGIRGIGAGAAGDMVVLYGINAELADLEAPHGGCAVFYIYELRNCPLPRAMRGRFHLSLLITGENALV